MNTRSFKYKVLLACILAAGLVSVSCNLTGYSDLGEPVNRFSQFGEGSLSFMRTYVDAAGNGVELLNISSLETPMGDCARMTLVADSKTILTKFMAGTYALDGDHIRLTFDIEYELLTQKAPITLDLSGTIKRELSPPRNTRYAWTHDKTGGLFTLDDKTYLRMNRVFDRVFNPDEPGRFTRFLKMILLNNLSVLTRIPGFAGIGMLNYIGKSTEFDGLLNGTMTLTSRGFETITSEYLFQEHMDLAGLTINGQFSSSVDLSGSGPMDGQLNFTAVGRTDSWAGSVDYSSVYITETLPSSGTYQVTIDGETQQVDFSHATPAEFDFFDILEPDSAN